MTSEAAAASASDNELSDSLSVESIAISPEVPKRRRGRPCKNEPCSKIIRKWINLKKERQFFFYYEKIFIEYLIYESFKLIMLIK